MATSVILWLVVIVIAAIVFQLKRAAKDTTPLNITSPRGSVQKRCPTCGHLSSIPTITCLCGFNFPASSTLLPEYANSEELLESAAGHGLDAEVTVKQKDPPVTPNLADDLSIEFIEKPRTRKKRKPKPITPAIVAGRLAHKKTYTFGISDWGQTTTHCHICLDQHFVFSIAADSAGVEHRCCLRCLRKLGGEEQINRAIARSGNANYVWNCIEALDQLRSEYPDPAHRPYGEKALLLALAGESRDDTHRIVNKIRTHAWTEYDLARIEGRPEPPSNN